MLNAGRLGRLQVKLLLLVFIAGLPAFALLFWLGLNDREQAIGNANAGLANIAHFAVLDQEKRLEGAQQAVALLSRVPVVRGGDAKACASLLDDLRHAPTGFYNFGVLNIDGSPRCSALPLPVAADAADRQWFRRALDKRQFTVSGHIPSRPSGQPTLQFAVPLYNSSDQASGVVFASWELTSLEKSLANLPLDRGTRLIIADRRGVVLGSVPANPGTIGQLLPDGGVLDAIRAGTAGNVAIGDESSAPVLRKIDIVRVGDMVAMYTIASIDRAAVVSRINDRAVLILAAWLGALALALAIAWRLGGRWVSRRAATVSTIARQIGAGKLAARTTFRNGPDELDQIGFAIDRMAGSLEQREQQLLASDRRLSEAQRIADLGNWEYALSGRGIRWSPGIGENFALDDSDNSFGAFLASVHPDDRQRVQSDYQSALDNQGAIDIEFRIVGSNNKLHWAHVIGKCVFDAAGHVAGLAGSVQDISGRKNAAAALVASEERYRQLFRVNPLPIAILDTASLHYTAANDVFCRQYGYTEEELISLPVIELVPAELRDAVLAQIRSLPMGMTTTKGLRNVRKDGTAIDVEITRIRTEIGGRDMVIVSPIDITGRIRADRSLKASEERYRILFENNPLPLWVFDPVSLRFLDVNDVACERYGYRRAEFLAMTCRDIRPAEDIPLLEAYLRTETRAVSVSGPWRHRRKDGTPMLVEVTMHEAILDGKPARFVCPIDVTEKVYAQEEIRRMNLLLESKVEMRTEELARSLALQQSLIDSVPQIVWLADPDGAVTFANRIWSEKIGVTANDWQGDGWSKALHPDDLEPVMRAWRQAAPANDKFEIEYRLLHRDGGYHDYQVNARKVFARTGAPICWVGICSDVTDGRRREDALRFANQELEAFSSSVSHDLRAPLRTIDGFSERLQLEYADRLDEQGRHYLARIRAGAANMNRLIDDLLSLSRVTRSEMVMTKVDLSKLAHQVFEELRQHQPDHPVEIVIQERMTAIGDVGLLRVVLVNLIGNALKFSGKRPVIRIEVGENPLPGDTSMFFVRDNGAGFDPAYAGRMFGVFQRLHTAAEFPGTGIGLVTVRRIIHRHGGRVSAEGAVDQGARIIFSLRRE